MCHSVKTRCGFWQRCVRCSPCVAKNFLVIQSYIRHWPKWLAPTGWCVWYWMYSQTAWGSGTWIAPSMDATGRNYSVVVYWKRIMRCVYSLGSQSTVRIYCLILQKFCSAGCCSLSQKEVVFNSLGWCLLMVFKRQSGRVSGASVNNCNR